MERCFRSGTVGFWRLGCCREEWQSSLSLAAGWKTSLLMWGTRERSESACGRGEVGLGLLNVRSLWNSQTGSIWKLCRTQVGQMGHTAWVVAEVMGVNLP